MFNTSPKAQDSDREERENLAMERQREAERLAEMSRLEMERAMVSNSFPSSLF